MHFSPNGTLEGAGTLPFEFAGLNPNGWYHGVNDTGVPSASMPGAVGVLSVIECPDSTGEICTALWNTRGLLEISEGVNITGEVTQAVMLSATEYVAFGYHESREDGLAVSTVDLTTGAVTQINCEPEQMPSKFSSSLVPIEGGVCWTPAGVRPLYRSNFACWF